MDDDIFFGGGGVVVKAGARMIYRVLLKLPPFLFQFLLLQLTMIIIYWMIIRYMIYVLIPDKIYFGSW